MSHLVILRDFFHVLLCSLMETSLSLGPRWYNGFIWWIQSSLIFNNNEEDDLVDFLYFDAVRDFADTLFHHFLYQVDGVCYDLFDCHLYYRQSLNHHHKISSLVIWQRFSYDHSYGNDTNHIIFNSRWRSWYFRTFQSLLNSLLSAISMNWQFLFFLLSNPVFLSECRVYCTISLTFYIDYVDDILISFSDSTNIQFDLILCLAVLYPVYLFLLIMFQ